MPDTLTLVRDRPPAGGEEQWAQAVSRPRPEARHGAGPFALRANVSPVDFLLRHVPHLTAAGFEIYGEEALTSARVNRNQPTLSLRVSSGIDWFDVEAVVQFGDLEVTLKEIRRPSGGASSTSNSPTAPSAPSRRTGWSATATCSRWARRPTRACGCPTHHVALLDQTAAAKATRSRPMTSSSAAASACASSRRSRRSQCRRGFQGELRPYQKAGLDWLHFLHDYEFGGCLADDMGLGKTVAGARLPALAASESGHAKTASLIVLPRSLIFNWEREAAKFTPEPARAQPRRRHAAPKTWPSSTATIWS